MAKKKQAKQGAPKKRGRPSIYSEALAGKLCDRLSKGESLNAICKSEGMPGESTVRGWAIDPKHPFSAKYAQARELGYLKMADELLEIADDGSNDWMLRNGRDDEPGYVANGENIQRSRLRVDTRKWLLSKCLPKVYGERITNELTGKDGGPIETKDVSDIESAQRVAFMLGQALSRRQSASAQAR